MTFNEDSPFHILITSYQLVSDLCKRLEEGPYTDRSRRCKMRSTSRG